MDPWLLQALADMTPEEFAEALRTGQFTPQKRLPWPVLEGEIIPSAPKPVRPGLPAGAPALPSGAPQLGPGLPGLPSGGVQAALPRGAIPQPTGAFAGAPPAAPQYQPIPLSSIREGAAVGAEQFGNMDTAVRSPPVPGSPQFAEAATRVQPSGPQAPNPLRVPLPRNGAQPFPAASPSMTDPGLSAVRPKPFGLEDLISSDRPVPGASTPAPAAPLRSLPIPELPGEPLPTPRGPSVPALIAAADAPVRPAVPAPAAPTSMPQLPGMSGISQVEGAFGAGPSAQADAWRQYLAGKGGQPGLAGAASGAGMGAPVPPAPGSVPGVPNTVPGVPPPTTQAVPTPAPAQSPGVAAAAGGAAASRFSRVLSAVRPALGKLGIAGTAYGAASDAAGLAGQADAARDPSLSPIENFGRGVAAVGSSLFAPPAPPSREEMLADPVGAQMRYQAALAGGNTPIVRNFNPVAMGVNAGSALADLGGKAINWAITRPGAERFTEAQPGTSATIRAAMSSGQSRPQDFDMDADGSPPGQSMAQEKAEYGPAPVRPKTNGAARPSGGKGTGAPAIPPSPETGVSGGSSGPGTSPYKLLGETLSVPLLDKMAVRPGSAPSPTPTGSWRDKGYTAMLNDKRGVVGEGRRLPLGAGPGEGARYGLDTEMKGNLGSAVRPSTGLNLRNAVPEYLEPEGEVPETEEDKRARLAAAKARVSPIFAGLDSYSR